MKCKNCEFEHTSKFCPECGFPAEEKPKEKSKGEQALEMIKDTNEKLTKLVNEREESKAKAKEKREKEGKENGKGNATGKQQSRGILDLF